MGMDENSDLKVETETLLFAVQEQALRTNAVKSNIDKTKGSPLCRLCGEECISHSSCMWMQSISTEGIRRGHDCIARIVH